MFNLGEIPGIMWKITLQGIQTGLHETTDGHSGGTVYSGKKSAEHAASIFRIGKGCM